MRETWRIYVRTLGTPPQLKGFLRNPSNERDTMRGWFVFAIMVLMIFGPPLLDELSRLQVRRAAHRVRPIVHGPISIVPDENEQDPLRSHNAAHDRKTKEYVA